MIGSFWNLCRACPSMPVDKLHSEYRSTYRWHEYTGPRQEVVRRAPQPTSSGPHAPGAGLASTRPPRPVEEAGNESNEGPRIEPALPRRKKNPELAYRTHEFLAMSEVIGSDDSLDSTINMDRARSEERERVRPSRRSKSEGPRLEYRLQCARRKRVLRSDSDPCEGDGEHYMFAWPRGRSGSGRARPGAGIRTEEIRTAVPRKSLSMGAIRPGSGVQSALAGVHKKRSTDYDRGEEGTAELEPLVGGETMVDGTGAPEQDELCGEEKIQDEILSKEEKPRRRKEFKTEYKKKFRPFSQYDYVEGKFQKKKGPEDTPLSLLLTDGPQSDSWYREVLELRKKAGEYKHRGWGTELVPQHIAELYNKQMTLWEQVSRRSSLSALSLASTTPRSITKEEKEKENNKKSSPTKPLHRPTTTRPSTAPDKSADKKKMVEDKDIKKDGPRSRKEYLIRHHLERTTGSVDGVLLPSPTREKLEPVIPRQKEEDLPKSPQKASPKSSPRSARSQSVGPGMNVERRSPKRQPRTPSAAPVSHKAAPSVQPERRPRPTSLTTTAPYRPKSSAGSFKAEDGKSHQVTKPKPMSAKPTVGQGDKSKVADKKPSDGEETPTSDVADAGPELNSAEIEPPALVKSPPEPTRVKSPEQILMRSPEPVNWTVPLDTGKTFTVTQNVRQGEPINRPHSEVKAWTPPGVPPPAPQSAPPQLPQEWKSSSSDPPSDNFTGINGVEEKYEVLDKSTTQQFSSSTPPDSTQFDTSVAGTTLRCLEDPGPYQSIPPTQLPDPTASHGPYRVLEAPSPTSPPLDPSTAPPLVSPTGTGRSMASDVLEKARNRFDKFWGTAKGKDEKEGKV